MHLSKVTFPIFKQIMCPCTHMYIRLCSSNYETSPLPLVCSLAASPESLLSHCYFMKEGIYSRGLFSCNMHSLVDTACWFYLSSTHVGLFFLKKKNNPKTCSFTALFYFTHNICTGFKIYWTWWKCVLNTRYPLSLMSSFPHAVNISPCFLSRSLKIQNTCKAYCIGIVNIITLWI